MSGRPRAVGRARRRALRRAPNAARVNSSSRRILRAIVSPSTARTTMNGAPSTAGSLEAVTTSATGTPPAWAARSTPTSTDMSRGDPLRWRCRTYCSSPARNHHVSRDAPPDRRVRPATGAPSRRRERRAASSDWSSIDIRAASLQPATGEPSAGGARRGVRVDGGAATGVDLEVQVRRAAGVARVADVADHVALVRPRDRSPGSGPCGRSSTAHWRPTPPPRFRRGCCART